MAIEIGGFLSIAALLLGLFAWLRRDMAAQDERLHWDIAKQSERLTAVERGQADSRERMARLEGLLEGLREAVTSRRNAA